MSTGSNRVPGILRMAAAASVMAALAGCAGGGGGDGGPSGDPGGGGPTISDTPVHTDGSTPLANAPAGTEFPFYQAEGRAGDGGGTLEGAPGSRKASLTMLDNGKRLKVESVGLDATFDDATDASGNALGGISYEKEVAGNTVRLDLYAGAPGANLDYMDFGGWAVESGSSADLAFGFGAAGYETTPAGMPTTGTASYSGGMVGVAVDGTGAVYDLAGPATMSADFATGAVTGGFTSIATAREGGASNPWNSVTFGASIASGTNGFSGTTSVTGANDNPGGLDATASGAIIGRFFGPDAVEAGGAWNLQDSDTVATGSFGMTTSDDEF